MKIKRKNTKFALIIVVALLVLLTGGIAYALTAPLREDTATSEQSDTNSDEQVNSEENSATDDSQKTNTNTDQPAAVTVDEATGKKVVQVVTSADVSNNTVYIRGGINNAVVSEGTCFAALTGPNGQTIQKDTTLLQNASTTDCKTISISSNELSAGKWTYTLNYTSNTMEGKSDANTFEI